MSGYFRISCALVICLVVSSSFGRSVREDKDGLARQIAEANNYLALDVYQKLRGSSNVFFSPLSLSSALSMLYLGARDNTADQMRKVLGFDRAQLDDQQVHQANRQVLDRLQAPRDEYTLNVANKVLTQEDIGVKEEYKQDLLRYYDAELEEVDFTKDAPAIADKVNQWVREKTRNKISSLLDDNLDESTALILLNAVYFKGTWKTKFDKAQTRDDTFYNSGNKEKRVPMMYLNSRFPYADSYYLRDSKLLELPYVGENISMVLILPNDRNGLHDLESSLTAENLKKALDELYISRVIVKIPKFKLQESYNMNDVLRDLGMEEAFSEDDAVFSGITDDEELAVSKILHKAVVEVNEEGSEAAAVTGSIIGRPRPGPPPMIYEFVADHPFIFLIREKNTGLILFMGKVDSL